MSSADTTRDNSGSLLAAWRTSCAATAWLVDHLPPQLWGAGIPGRPSKSIRMLAAHLHNSRRSWTRTLGQEHGIAVPAAVDRRTVTRRALLAALRRSARGIASVLELGLANGGVVPPSKRYVWRNLPLDVGHVLAYFVAHEAHHRGQIVMVAQQLGAGLPRDVTGELWQWQRLSGEWRA